MKLLNDHGEFELPPEPPNPFAKYKEIKLTPKQLSERDPFNMPERKYGVHECAWCGEKFVKTTWNKIYCSVWCSMAARDSRRKKRGDAAGEEVDECAKRK